MAARGRLTGGITYALARSAAAGLWSSTNSPDSNFRPMRALRYRSLRLMLQDSALVVNFNPDKACPGWRMT